MEWGRDILTAGRIKTAVLPDRGNQMWATSMNELNTNKNNEKIARLMAETQ
jgi:hypothetical protein